MGGLVWPPTGWQTELVIRVGIVEDEAPSRALLRQYLQRYEREAGERFAVTEFTTSAQLTDRYRPDFDLLLLDIDFKGGESGIEALEQIRELAPSLNITLLSAYDDINLIIPANKKYNVKYLKKPISANELLIHINEIREQQEKYDQLRADLSLYEDWINRIEKEEEQKLPVGLSDLITGIFNNITFTIQAIKDLLVYGDYRVYNALKVIDLKLPATNGMYEKNTKTKIKNYEKVKEYRYSQKGRIFVSYQAAKPLVICIDTNHKVFA